MFTPKLLCQDMLGRTRLCRICSGASVESKAKTAGTVLRRLAETFKTLLDVSIVRRDRAGSDGRARGMIIIKSSRPGSRECRNCSKNLRTRSQDIFVTSRFVATWTGRCSHHLCRSMMRVAFGQTGQTTCTVSGKKRHRAELTSCHIQHG